MQALEISSEWIEIDIIDTNGIITVYNNFLFSSDKNTEHYRFAILREWINSKNSLSDKCLDVFLNICFSDKEIAMGKSAVGLLIRRRILTSSQLDSIQEEISAKDKFLHRLLEEVSRSS